METKVFHSGTVSLFEPTQPLGLTRVVVPMWGYTAVEYFGNNNMWTNPVGSCDTCENVQDKNSSPDHDTSEIKMTEIETSSCATTSKLVIEGKFLSSKSRIIYLFCTYNNMIQSWKKYWYVTLYINWKVMNIVLETIPRLIQTLSV